MRFGNEGTFRVSYISCVPLKQSIVGFTSFKPNEHLECSNMPKVYISALQQVFLGTLGFRKTCSGVPWVLMVSWGFLDFQESWLLTSVCWCVIMNFFRSPCRIPTPS